MRQAGGVQQQPQGGSDTYYGEREASDPTSYSPLVKEHRFKPRYLLCKTLPCVCDISKSMHDRAHLRPHSRLHWYLRFIVVFGRGGASGDVLCICSTNSDSCRIRDTLLLCVAFWRFTLRMLTCSTRQSYRSDAVDKVRRLLFDSFALVILRSSSDTVGTSEGSSLGLLHTSLRADERDWSWRKHGRSSWWIYDEGDEGDGQQWHDKIQGPSNEVCSAEPSSSAGFSP